MKNLPFKQVVIIGAGIGGIDMACALKRKLDFDDFIIYDRNAGIGGTWYDNDCELCPSLSYLARRRLIVVLRPGMCKSP
jgi:cation diffusion facilitator CzcD-associated flavoprotein CzcO